MTSDTKRYIALQNLYQNAAKEACSKVTTRVHQHLRSVGKSIDLIPVSEIRRFCKNSAYLDCISTRPIDVDLGSCEDVNHEVNPLMQCLQQAGESDLENLLNIYILFLAADTFFALNQKYPGDCNTKDCESDLSVLKMCVSNLVSKLNGNTSPSHFAMPDELIEEMVRFGASEVHSVASFVGGVASHEVIKLLTSQYVPFSDLFVYNGISCSSATFKF